MNINYLIELLSNRLSVLNLAKDQAFSSGDLDRVNSLDTEIFGVQDTLAKLKLLQNASREAAATNGTLVDAMTAESNVITNGSTECLDNYDISSYATDPLYEQKITDILTAMGPMISAEAIDTYISNEAIGSPVTGQMILDAAQTYTADVRLMMAIMELDSRFGTAGVGVVTLNPGNIGNTGTTTRTYNSWADGVEAVAEWLDNHRKIVVPTPPVVDTTTPALTPTDDTSTTTDTTTPTDTTPADTTTDTTTTTP